MRDSAWESLRPLRGAVPELGLHRGLSSSQWGGGAAVASSLSSGLQRVRGGRGLHCDH